MQLNKYMKKMFLPLFLMMLTYISAKGQSDTIKNEENRLRNYFIKRMYAEFNELSLGEKPAKKLLYYSYKIVSKDSVVWKSYNFNNKMIDSITYAVFKIAIDSIKKIGNINLLKNKERTFIPLFILYKTYSDNGLNSDAVSIENMVNAFSWENNDSDAWNTEAVHRVFVPILLRIPNSKSYYEIKKE